MRKKEIAALLALILGIFGAHRFYLGQRLFGALYFLAFFFTLAITVSDHVPLIMGPAILAVLDAVLLAVMPGEEFDRRYNRQNVRERRWADPRDEVQEALPAPNPAIPYRRSGLHRFRNGDYEGAVADFAKALHYDPDDPAIHFNTACAHSMRCDIDAALRHLEAAVAHGFDDTDRVHSHAALAYVRDQPDFEAFVAQGYRVPPPTLLPPIPPPPKTDDVLEQIAQLGELRDLGILSEEEFSAQKQRLLE